MQATGAPAVDAERQAAIAESAAKSQQVTEVMPPPVVSPRTEHLDPELIELFIEEAKEEISSIKRHLPAWSASPDDLETLITVRRSFHTLKGSGRMVGAERIGEYCWAVENLLNRLINRTLARTPPMVEFILEAAAAVPDLVEQLEVGTEPAADISLLIARANAFAEGDPNAALLQIKKPDGPGPEAETPALEMDPVLYDIFSTLPTSCIARVTRCTVARIWPTSNAAWPWPRHSIASCDVSTITRLVFRSRVSTPCGLQPGRLLRLWGTSTARTGIAPITRH